MAVMVVLLAILTFFIFQNRKNKRHLLHLQREKAGDPPRQERAEPGMQEHENDFAGELDVTHYEITQPDAPQHEIAGKPLFSELDITHYEITQPDAP